jgi:hypothetical protein
VRECGESLRSVIACLLCLRQHSQPVCRATVGPLPKGRGIEDGEPNLRRCVPYVKFPAAQRKSGREEALHSTCGFLLKIRSRGSAQERRTDAKISSRRSKGAPFATVMRQWVSRNRWDVSRERSFSNATTSLPSKSLAVIPDGGRLRAFAFLWHEIDVFDKLPVR